MSTEQISSPPKKPSIFARVWRWVRSKSTYMIVFGLITVLLVIFFWQRIVISIYPGEAGVLYKRFTGTEIDYIYPEGLHIISPIDDMYIYEVRNQIVRFQFNVLTVKGLRVHLELAIRYRPKYDLLGILHQSIGPDYLDRVVIPQIESVMRKELGTHTAEAIYTNKEGLLTNTILLALDEVGRNYVEVEDVIIRSIRLPDPVRAAIEEKLIKEERLKTYEFLLQIATEEAKRLEIQAGGIHTFHSIVNEALTPQILTYQGIIATEKLAESENSKIVVVGASENGLPLILGGPK